MSPGLVTRRGSTAETMFGEARIGARVGLEQGVHDGDVLRLAERAPENVDGEGQPGLSAQVEAAPCTRSRRGLGCLPPFERPAVAAVDVGGEGAEVRGADDERLDLRGAGAEQVALFAGGEPHVARQREATCGPSRNRYLARRTKSPTPDALPPWRKVSVDWPF